MASHWAAQENSPNRMLKRLSHSARNLRDLLTDPLRGACTPAYGDGLIIDPGTVASLTEALDSAFAGASRSHATLVLGFLGHGYVRRANAGSVGEEGDARKEEVFLFPIGPTPATPDPATALAVPRVLGELLMRHGGIREMTLVIDTCMAGFAGLGAARDWFPAAMQAGRNVEVLASADGRPAYNLNFSTALNGMIRNGHVRAHEKLYSAPVRALLGPVLIKQRPQFVSYGAGSSPSLDPGGPWLAFNAAYQAKLSPLAYGKDNSPLLPRLRHFQPPPALAALTDSVGRHRLLVLDGPMGSGKTTLAAALCRPELLPEGSPADVCALLRLTDAMVIGGRLPAHLTEQLSYYLSGFAEASATYREQTPAEERAARPTVESAVCGPLGLMEPRPPVRVVFDGLDQLRDDNRAQVANTLRTLTDLAPSWFGVVVTTREGVRLPGEWHREPIARAADRAQLTGFLHARGVAPHLHDAILAQGAGNWEIVRLLADHGPLSGESRVTYDEVYLHVLDRARQTAPRGRADWVDPVLTVLAAAGPGPLLPRRLLLEAARLLGGPADDTDLDGVLGRLPGLLETSGDGTGRHLGVHHQSLIEYLEWDSGLLPGHRVILEALGRLAPMDEHTPGDPLHAYAEEAEPLHLWHAAKESADPEPLYTRLLASLERRSAAEATVNKDRWGAWADRLSLHPGPDTAVAMIARDRAAYWTGKAGSYRRSRELYRELLAAQSRVLPGHDPRLLESRHRIAYATGELGDFREAVRAHRAVLEDQTAAFGADDPRTLRTRHHIAYWTGRGGEMAQGLRLHEALLEDQLQALGPLDPDVLESRHYIAYWYGRLGRPEEALAMHAELLRDRVSVFGEDHEQVVFSRMNICRFLGESGRLTECLDSYERLLPDVRRLRGEEHPNTLLVRLNVARFRWELGDAAEALALHEALLPDQRRILGSDHPTVLICRHNTAMLRAELGDTAGAAAELDVLYGERLARYGTADHPEVLTTRYGQAWLLGRLGRWEEASEEMRAVLRDRTRVLGADHPDTLTAASVLGGLLIADGADPHRAGESEELLRATLAAQRAKAGERHPRTMDTRARLARTLRVAGRGAEAAELLTALLPHQAEVLGEGHPDTARTRRALDGLTG